jgi:hypothetical protein
VPLLETFRAPLARLTGLAILCALIGASPSMAYSDAATKPSGDAPTLTKEELTALSGLTVSARRTPSVSELTVAAPVCPAARPDVHAQPPKLVSSYPGRGSIIRGGIVILRLTFDRPMTCMGLLDNVGPYPDPCPAPLRFPMVSRDRRTFLTVCNVQVDRPINVSRTTSVQLGRRDSPRFGLRLANFISAAGQPLDDTDLDFYVDPSSEPVRTMREAMAQDKFLRDAEKAAEYAR